MLGNIFSKVLSYFWVTDESSDNDNTEIGLSAEEASAMFREACEEDDEQPIEEDTNCNKCIHKTGKITSSSNNIYTIDNNLQFTSNNVFKTGDQVTYTLYVTGQHKSVTDVELVENECFNKATNKRPKICLRTLVSKVIKRQQREIWVSPGDLKVDLNNTSAEFIPITGDWIELDIKCELLDDLTNLYGEILEIVSLRPLRAQIVIGRIKQWNNNTMTGVVNNYIYFNVDSLINGYQPTIGDEVTTECIESEQENYKWRSIKIILNKSTANHKHKTNNAIKGNNNFNRNVDSLVITDNIIVDFNKYNEVSSCFIDIHNKKSNTIVLLQAEFKLPYIQCKICTSCENIIIKPDEKYQLKIECRAKYVGVYKELLLLTFDDFQIGRWIEMYLEPVASKFIKKQYVNKNRDLMKRARDLYYAPQVDRYVGGENVHAPCFVGVPLKSYNIPKELHNLIFEYNSYQDDTTELNRQIGERYKFITSPLSYSKYQEYFSLLLHLDEIYEMISIRVYDMDSVYFIKNGEYLMLEVQNLSEKRPSLITGDKIIATKVGDSTNTMAYEGHIHKTGSNHVYVKFASELHQNYNDEKYSVVMVASRTQYRRKHQAIQLASRNLGEHVLFPKKVIVKPAQVNFTYDKYDKLDGLQTSRPNRNALLFKKIQELAQNSEKDLFKCKYDVVDTVSFEHAQKMNAIIKGKVPKLEWYDKNLNFYQKEAVRNILLGTARPLPYIIFGPPGTGKTITVIETALQILRLIPHARLLLCAPSNSAANLIAFRMINSGVLKPGELIRCVANKCVVDNSIPPKLLPYCATVQIAKEGTTSEQISLTNEGLRFGMDASTLGKHKVTITTCSLAGVFYNMGITTKHFSHIIIDEAGQTSEPELMSALSFLDVRNGQAILAGDPKQLGPVILSNIAQQLGLAESYLERLINRFPYARDVESFPDSGGYDPRLVTRLVYNYRSLPEILALPNKMFYEGTLIPTVSATGSKEAALLKRLKEMLPVRNNDMPPAVVFHGIIGENFQTFDSPSWFNPHEASQVFFYINELYHLGVQAEDIGVISPYVKQCRQIEDILLEAEYDVPKIGSVEDFQGQEFSVILLSTVRSDNGFVDKNLQHKLSFVSNPRRLNVALSRAKSLLIIIGNPKVLNNDNYWSSVINYCVENGSYCGCR